MTDQLNPEDRALIELVSRWRLEASVADMTRDEPRSALFSRVASELDLLVSARLSARAEGRRSPGGGGEISMLEATLCPTCRGVGLVDPDGLPERVNNQCVDAGPCPHSPGPKFRTGDVVTVLRSVSNSPGWLDVWVDGMNEMIGKSGMIEGEIDGGYEIGGFSYPAEVLALANVGGEAVHTGQLRDDQSSSPPPSGDVREASLFASPEEEARELAKGYAAQRLRDEAAHPEAKGGVDA